MNAESLTDRRKLEFLAAYYEINGAYARLEAAAEEDRSPVVARLDALLTARDKLEDRYSPIGFYGEPQLEGTRTINVVFMHAAKLSSTRAVLSSLAMELPSEIPLSADAPRRRLDTAGFIRFLDQQISPTDGKADP